MSGAKADIWSTVHAERRALVADLTGLRAEQWSTASLCPGWDVHDVLAHLVDTARTGRHGVDWERRPDPRDTLAALAGVADLTRTPPATIPPAPSPGPSPTNSARPSPSAAAGSAPPACG